MDASGFGFRFGCWLVVTVVFGGFGCLAHKIGAVLGLVRWFGLGFTFCDWWRAGFLRVGLAS